MLLLIERGGLNHRTVTKEFSHARGDDLVHSVGVDLRNNLVGLLMDVFTPHGYTETIRHVSLSGSLHFDGGNGQGRERHAGWVAVRKRGFARRKNIRFFTRILAVDCWAGQDKSSCLTPNVWP